MKNLSFTLSAAILMLPAFVAFGALWGPQLVPDYDRNGMIDYADRDKAHLGNEFTIWLNDDDDAAGVEADDGKGDTNSDLHNAPHGQNNNRDCEDDQVNGHCDLLDFFPVLVDVDEVSDWRDRTWKLSSDSVNVVFTKLDADYAGGFHTVAGATQIYGPELNQAVYEATVSKLAEEDVELPDAFLNDGKGVFLIEGAALVEGGITLRGEKGDGDFVEVTLNLRVNNVEEMYGWVNLRQKAVPSSNLPYRLPSTSQRDNRHFIFVHGYNTTPEEARGSAAEFYKRLWQSGSDARFTAVEWRGDQSRQTIENLGVTFCPNYFANVENAFAAAKSFALACAGLPGEKILVGHALGNVLIASAIQDYGLDYVKFVMLNAEIARKDFDVGGRFAALPRTLNYYSPSDSFFAESLLDLEQCENRDLMAALIQKTGFWSLNAHLKTNADAIARANGIMGEVLGTKAEDLITDEQLAYADVVESPAAGANPIAMLGNVNMEDFIGANEDWPLYVGGEGNDERTNVWNHSAFCEVAFYHTSAFYTSIVATGKPRVIIDTDLGSSMDDLFTIDFAARMHRAGKLELLAVMMDRPDGCDLEGAGEFLKFTDQYLASLGLGDLPLGRSESLAKDCLPQQVFNPYWTLIYSNNVMGVGALMPKNRTDAELATLPNAVCLYRRLLKDAPDKSVVICSTGFLNNLKALMESGTNYEEDGIESTGLELIAAKVKELRIMGGCFDPAVAPEGTGGAEYNVAGDPTAAKKVFEQWPSPVVVSPWEVGLALEYNPEEVLADFPVGTPNPVLRTVYECWPNPTEGILNRLWDVMTVLPLVEGDALVPLSEKGGISVIENGITTFTLDASSNRCYQVASNMDATAVMNRFREICRIGNPSEGAETNPWKVGPVGHEDEVTAWTNGIDTLVVEGTGVIGSMPWRESADEITQLQFADGVTNLGETMATLPALRRVNGLTLDKFVEAGMLGAARAGFVAIAVEDGVAQLGIVVSTNGDLTATTESWGRANVEGVALDEETGAAILTIPATEKQGFMILKSKATNGGK